MEYQKNLAIHSIKHPFAENNMNIVIRFLVNKYEYLLKTMITSIPDDVEVDELDDEPVNDIVEIMMLSYLFPYIKEINSEIYVNNLIQNLFKKYIYEITIDLFNERQNISSKNTAFHENNLILKFKSMFSMNENYWDTPIKSFLKNNGSY